jgi:micrococcal nuclease
MNLRGIAVGAGLALCLVCAAKAQDAALCGGKQTSVRIAEAVDGSSLKLADGRIVRLANVIAPLPIDGDKEALAQAKKFLGEIVNGKDATLFLSSETKDRYERISGHTVLIEGKLWLESELLSRGLARVYLVANDKCAKVLLQYEAKARDARLGFWKEQKFAIFDAEAVDALLAAEGRFAVVEGTIRRVGEAKGRIYLDFGRRFTEDFTIIVPDTIRKALAAQGSDPKSWRGKRIRVRGILLSWGGPAIELNLAQAIELLDQLPDRDIPKSE